MEFYLHFILDMGRSLGFGSCTTDFIRPIQTRSRCASGTQYLKLARYYNSPDRSTKSTRSHLNVLSLLVSTRFQVLFHSPPGVLFTFPSRYSSLSVTKEYLALRGGPRSFTQCSTCLVLLWILPRCLTFRLRDFHPLWSVFPGPFHYARQIDYAVRTPKCMHLGLGSSAFARRY